jgi:hypothetical protein
MYSSETRGGSAKRTDGPVSDATAIVVFSSMYHDLPPGESEAAVERERRRRPEAAAVVGKDRRRRSDIAVSAGVGGGAKRFFLLLSVLGGWVHVDWVCSLHSIPRGGGLVAESSMDMFQRLLALEDQEVSNCGPARLVHGKEISV